MWVYPDFKSAIDFTRREFVSKALPVHSKFWQATDISKRPEAEMREIILYQFMVQVPANQFTLEDDIQPNMPWAEDHFQERVGRVPVNPGVTWEQWPWSNSADGHRKGGKFSHSYMERYWPKRAGRPELSGTDNVGIRFLYGDLDDVVKLIAKDPLTRQAYLPVFFPEDTGAVHGERIPCSIGYHFLLREGRLHCTYQLRSCDLWRHFADDLYLTARLMQWVCEELVEHGVVCKPGLLSVHIASLHTFINDYHALAKSLQKPRA